ncbi:hypothetical protein EQG49_02475 [Periweissella cryptocerci]|uniref:Uncharacterized protein n=1 Tax=Periweissella cryptocerci TaxID=2506420 RepID=A0A4P6YRW2_9LACO|nr:hypothetical protein [Periweissella cryptocerci]QBO35408.1 hypothetical protein EQG49_02475 [Periweissella cryptocerci]
MKESFTKFIDGFVGKKVLVTPPDFEPIYAKVDSAGNNEMLRMVNVITADGKKVKVSVDWIRNPKTWAPII